MLYENREKYILKKELKLYLMLELLIKKIKKIFNTLI